MALVKGSNAGRSGVVWVGLPSLALKEENRRDRSNPGASASGWCCAIRAFADRCTPRKTVSARLQGSTSPARSSFRRCRPPVSPDNDETEGRSSSGVSAPRWRCAAEAFAVPRSTRKAVSAPLSGEPESDSAGWLPSVKLSGCEMGEAGGESSTLGGLFAEVRGFQRSADRQEGGVNEPERSPPVWRPM
jgi:hypothetical protein